MNEITSGLFLGDQDDAKIFHGQVICVAENRPEQVQTPKTICIPIHQEPDGKVVARTYLLDIAAAAIARAYQEGDVLVHCVSGIHRAPLALAWYYHKHCHMTLDEAYELMLKKRFVQRIDHWIEKWKETGRLPNGQTWSPEVVNSHG